MTKSSISKIESVGWPTERELLGIKEDTEVMKDKLTSIEEIHAELLDLRVKYNQLSEDITEIKIAISELSESGVGAHA